MIKMINALTKTVMYVDEARKEEYLKNGHSLAQAKEEPKEEASKPAAKKKATKK